MRPGHVLIKILATGVNRLDHYIREGSVAPDLPLPHILGSDASGEVVEFGKGVQRFEVGVRVILVPGYPLKEEDNDIRPIVTAPSFVLPGLHIWGTYAQYMEVPAHGLVKDRTGLKPEEGERPGRPPVGVGTGSRRDDQAIPRPRSSTQPSGGGTPADLGQQGQGHHSATPMGRMRVK